MKFNLLSPLGALVLLSACTTIVDTTIPLPENFSRNATQITLDTPTLRLSDKVYNQTLDTYAVENADISWKDVDEHLVDRHTENNYLNYLLFDESIAQVVETFEVRESSYYSFDLQSKVRTEPVKNQCDIFSNSFAEEYRDLNVKQHQQTYSSNLRDRISTFLVCRIQSVNGMWQLSLKNFAGETSIVSLMSESEAFRVRPISGGYNIVRDGDSLRTRAIPPWAQNNTGLGIYQNEKQVAAVSFYGKPKIWILNSLEENTKALLLSASYSLVMFNWLDDDWKD